MMNWRDTARPNQLPPEGDWRVFLMSFGRGAGKTQAGANWLVEEAMKYPNTRWAVIAPTWRDCRLICIEGCSGIIRALPNGELEDFNYANLILRLKNGSEIRGFSSDGINGVKNLASVSGIWMDELDSMSKMTEEVWKKKILPSVGAYGRVFITTTPKLDPHPLTVKFVEDPEVFKTFGSTFDNAANLSPKALEELRKRYDGTFAGAGQLHGKVMLLKAYPW